MRSTYVCLAAVSLLTVRQAFIAVDESGTEASAGTAVVLGGRGAPPMQFELKVDRPFIYLIRDVATDTIVFMGRVLDPSQ